MVCNGIYRTDSDAASAAGAFIRCDGGLFLCDGNCVVCTVALAGSAADAFIGKDKGLVALCISSFPAREPQPIPIFLSAPPKPVDS